MVIAESVPDPRWIALAGRAPRVQLVHDERRDDGRHRQVFARAVFDRWGAHSAATVTYSNYAAIAVPTRRDVVGAQLNVAPLCSDLDPMLVPPFVGPDGRHDFVVAGRLGVDDVDGRAAAFDDLSDPLTATLRGGAAARHYADCFAVDRAVDGLLEVLTEVGR